MRKVFLLFVFALFGVVAFAGNTWELKNGTITLDYNGYGTTDRYGTSINWNGGNIPLIIDAIEASNSDVYFYRSGWWYPEYNDLISFSVTGVASMTGELGICVVDESVDADYYTELSNSVNVKVTKGKQFTLEGYLCVNNTEFKQGGLFLNFIYGGTSHDSGFDDSTPFKITSASMNISFVRYDDPLIFWYSGIPAETGFCQYEARKRTSIYSTNLTGYYANVTISGNALSDVESLLFQLVDDSQQTDGHFFEPTSEAQEFATDIKKGERVSYRFSYQLTNSTHPMDDPNFISIVYAETNKKTSYVVFENASVSVSVSSTPLYFNDADFGYSNNNDGSTVTLNSARSDIEVANIPSIVEFDGTIYTVSTIGVDAFRGCSGLTSVTIPNSVTSIGSSAFYDCSGLTSVTIPNSVTSIGYNAFYGVTYVVYTGSASGSPWGATKVVGAIDENYEYKDAEKKIISKYIGQKTDVVIPQTVTTIAAGAFSDSPAITSVTIPSSVTKVEDGAFAYCI